jgi:hypothetical protein
VHGECPLAEATAARCGETGRRARLGIGLGVRFSRPQPPAGSSPATGTIIIIGETEDSSKQLLALGGLAIAETLAAGLTDGDFGPRRICDRPMIPSE